MRLLDNITVNDMPTEDLRWVAEELGMAIAGALLINFGKGISIYIPSLKIDKKKITEEDLPNDDMRLVAEKCGIEVALKLLKSFPQSIIYIPRLETTVWARGYVKRNYTGNNAKRLATELGISERHVYKCLKFDDNVKIKNTSQDQLRLQFSYPK